MFLCGLLRLLCLLAMTRLLGASIGMLSERNLLPLASSLLYMTTRYSRHCEERSDEAVHSIQA